MDKHKAVYEDTLKYAASHNEKGLWQESYQANCECARAIEQIILENYDGKALGDNLADAIIDRFGFDRVNWVLANTVQQNKDDGRFSAENKQWAQKCHIPHETYSRQYSVASHPGLTNLFIDQVRKAWQTIGLFDASNCEVDDTEQDYTGKVVVIRPEYLLGEYRTPDYQLFLAEHGNGCRPHGGGREILGQFLIDGEKTWYFRSELIGVLKDKYLPDWAKEKLAQLQTGEPENQPVM